MDHVILNYHLMRNVSKDDDLGPDVERRVHLTSSGEAASRDMITRLLVKWGPVSDREAAMKALGSSDAFDYAEANILGNVHFANHGVKLLVANLKTLFGTERGQRLREWARDSGLVLTWAVGLPHDEPSPNASGGQYAQVPGLLLFGLRSSVASPKSTSLIRPPGPRSVSSRFSGFMSA